MSEVTICAECKFVVDEYYCGYWAQTNTDSKYNQPKICCITGKEFLPLKECKWFNSGDCRNFEKRNNDKTEDHNNNPGYDEERDW